VEQNCVIPTIGATHKQDNVGTVSDQILKGWLVQWSTGHMDDLGTGGKPHASTGFSSHSPLVTNHGEPKATTRG
jgi:hypothetical protein